MDDVNSNVDVNSVDFDKTKELLKQFLEKNLSQNTNTSMKNLKPERGAFKDKYLANQEIKPLFSYTSAKNVDSSLGSWDSPNYQTSLNCLDGNYDHSPLLRRRSFQQAVNRKSVISYIEANGKVPKDVALVEIESPSIQCRPSIKRKLRHLPESKNFFTKHKSRTLNQLVRSVSLKKSSMTHEENTSYQSSNKLQTSGRPCHLELDQSKNKRKQRFKHFFRFFKKRQSQYDSSTSVTNNQDSIKSNPLPHSAAGPSGITKRHQTKYKDFHSFSPGDIKMTEHEKSLAVEEFIDMLNRISARYVKKMHSSRSTTLGSKIVAPKTSLFSLKNQSYEHCTVTSMDVVDGSSIMKNEHSFQSSQDVITCNSIFTNNRVESSHKTTFTSSCWTNNRVDTNSINVDKLVEGITRCIRDQGDRYNNIVNTPDGLPMEPFIRQQSLQYLAQMTYSGFRDLAKRFCFTFKQYTGSSPSSHPDVFPFMAVYNMTRFIYNLAQSDATVDAAGKVVEYSSSFFTEMLEGSNNGLEDVLERLHETEVELIQAESAGPSPLDGSFYDID